MDLWVDEGIDPCGGTLPAYDRFVERFFGVWNDGDVPPDFRAELHAVTRETFETQSACTADGSGCASGTVAWTSRMDSAHHELVHVMAGTRSAPWIGEGVAVAFGQGGLATLADPSTFGIYAGSSTELGWSGYIQAGIFTRHLIDTHGATPVRAYHDAVRRGDSQQVLDEEFERAFGVSLEQALEAFGSEEADGSVRPGCTYQLWTCDDAEPVELPFVEEEMDCGSPNVRGFSFDESATGDLSPYAPQRIIRFEVKPDEGPVDPDAWYPSDEFGWISINQINATVRLERCGDCQAQYVPGLPARHPSIVGPEGLEGTYPLPVGSYALLLSPLGTGPMRVEVSQTTPP